MKFQCPKKRAPSRPTCNVGVVRYPDELRPRDELVRLAWLAHYGSLCLASKGTLGKYVDALRDGPASDLDDTPHPGTFPDGSEAQREARERRLERACELFASGALSLAAKLGADVTRDAVVEKVRRFKWRSGKAGR